MPVLRVKKNGVWEDIMGGSNSEQLNGGNADTLDGKYASDFLTKEENDALTEALMADIGGAFATKDELNDRITHEQYSNYEAQLAQSIYTNIGNNYSTTTYVDGRVEDLINSAPETLNTLGELAKAVGNNPNFASDTSSEISSLNSKVGNETVSKQIATAVANLSNKTLENHLEEEMMVLTSLQYGATLPPAGNAGRIFFLRVNE